MSRKTNRQACFRLQECSAIFHTSGLEANSQRRRVSLCIEVLDVFLPQLMTSLSDLRRRDRYLAKAARMELIAFFSARLLLGCHGRPGIGCLMIFCRCTNFDAYSAISLEVRHVQLLRRSLRLVRMYSLIIVSESFNLPFSS